MGRLAPMTEMAIDMMAKEGASPEAIADSLNLTLPAIRDHLDVGPQPMRTIVWDLETTHLRSDIGTLLIGAFLDLGTDEIETATFSVDSSRSVRDREFQLALKMRELYSQADILIGHWSTGFDKNFLNGVLARHSIEPLPRRFHIDTLMVARYGMKGLLQSNSLDNIADFFGLGSKYRPSKHHWREAALLDEEAMADIQERCESDVRLTASIWDRLRPYWLIWKGV